MGALIILIPAALLLGGAGLAAFLWSMNSGQYDDLDGAAERIVYDDPYQNAPYRDEPTVPPTRER